ncbi:WYL domain-containing protein [Empedobacter stercoris]|uniref:helix-turn-helix transcriptional regulator n=1 Tax=Empedobacter stercoris TaxID=1628248 RepID=UPI001CE0B000|nr:WYL domain-containing protein [Empedobacter stercoris]MCA4782197.1 WYL domain-containing protein [Empedobacter stercoris]
MSETKNAFLRYQILDDCFSNFHRKYFLDDLIKKCSKKLSDYYGYEISVSKRTIQYDIDFMKGSGGNFAPIEKFKEGRKSYYRYSDPSYSFMKKDLDANEFAVLKDALITMSRIKGLPGFDWLSKMQVQLETALDIDTSKEKIISFEGNEYLKGIEYLHQLYRQIINKEVLEVLYHPFTEVNPIQVLISPYYLKEYNKRWFLLGMNHNENYIQTLALDRIVLVESTTFEYTESTIDFENYFNEIIGVTNYQDKQVEKVKIELMNNIIPYLETKPLHEEQWIEGNVLVLNIKLNYELESLIHVNRQQKVDI